MEGEAGASRLNPIDADDSSKLEDPPEAETVADEPSESGDGADQSDSENATESEDGADQDVAAARGRSRLSRGWLVGIAALLVLCAGAIGAGGYFALRFHHDSQAITHNDAAALKAAVDWLSGTQAPAPRRGAAHNAGLACLPPPRAPDPNALVASEQKIIDCGTDAFRAQA